MRIFSFIPALAALATAVVGVALPGQGDCSFETACEPASKRGFSGEHAARNDPGLTNAALLRRGLPIKKPIMKSRRGTFMWLWRITPPPETSCAMHHASIVTSRYPRPSFQQTYPRAVSQRRVYTGRARCGFQERARRRAFGLCFLTHDQPRPISVRKHL